MSATLKDLAPAEKEKVARLICQVVEKETQLRELEEKAAFFNGVSAGAGAAKAEQLTEQNAQLARENTRFVCAMCGKLLQGSPYSDVAILLPCSRHT